MSLILKPVAIHSIVGNAPYIISVAASAAINPSRTFYGTGAPSSSTLADGNGMYNAAQSGFVLNASLVNAGTGYTVGGVLTLADSCTQDLQITVDMVNDSGAIIDFHISQLAKCAAYPSNPVSVTSGSATFNLNFPAPDRYLDMTTATAPVEYVCTTAGSNSTSVWAKISGGGGGLIALYDTSGDTAYSGGSIVWVPNAFSLGGITVLPGTYGLLSSQNTAATPTGNQIPQIPVPTSGTVYWIPIAPGLVAASTCVSGTTQQVYVAATSPF
jgi:hypothetical protein